MIYDSDIIDERRLDKDHRIINKGDLVLLTYDFDNRLFESPTIGTVLSSTYDEYKIQIYTVYWFDHGFKGTHYWYNVQPVTLEEIEKGLINNYGLRHSQR